MNSKQVVITTVYRKNFALIVIEGPESISIEELTSL